MGLKDIPLRPASSSDWPKWIHRVLFGLFIAQFVLVWARLGLRLPIPSHADWPEGLLLLLATATTLAALACRLPGQNVMLATCIIVGLGGIVQTVGATTGVPFGPIVYTERIGHRLFEPLPWAPPLLCLVALLNARGVARLVMRPRTTSMRAL